jgi:hypothetical protein
VTYQTVEWNWVAGDVAAAQQHLRPMASARTEMVVRRGRQTKKKRQQVTAEIRSCPLRLSYDTAVRREGQGELVHKDLWLVEVQVLRSTLKPWLLITDWPVEDAGSAVQILRMYRQRWAVEDSFKFTKGILGWEEVRLLARLGGWGERKDNPPGKIVLTRGLRRLMNMLHTQAFLDRYRQEHGALPPRIAAWIGKIPPQELWPNVNS